MRFDSLNADLRRWLQTSIEAGHDGEALQQAMRAAGYDGGFARQAVELAIARVRTAVAGPAQPQPVVEPFAATANTVVTSDRTVEILFTVASPRIVLFGNLLSADECEQMIEASRRRLQRSTVVNGETRCSMVSSRVFVEGYAGGRALFLPRLAMHGARRCDSIH